MNIRDYLTGNFEEDAFSEGNILFALEKYEIDSTLEHTLVGERQRDLALAQLYEIFSNKSNGSGRSEKRDTLSVSERSYSMSNASRDFHRGIALRLRAKWGEDTGIELSEFHSQSI